MPTPPPVNDCHLIGSGVQYQGWFLPEELSSAIRGEAAIKHQTRQGPNAKESKQEAWILILHKHNVVKIVLSLNVDNR